MQRQIVCTRRESSSLGISMSPLSNVQEIQNENSSRGILRRFGQVILLKCTWNTWYSCSLQQNSLIGFYYAVLVQYTGTKNKTLNFTPQWILNDYISLRILLSKFILYDACFHQVVPSTFCSMYIHCGIFLILEKQILQEICQIQLTVFHTST